MWGKNGEEFWVEFGKIFGQHEFYTWVMGVFTSLTKNSAKMIYFIIITYHMNYVVSLPNYILYLGMSA